MWGGGGRTIQFGGRGVDDRGNYCWRVAEQPRPTRGITESCPWIDSDSEYGRTSGSVPPLKTTWPGPCTAIRLCKSALRARCLPGVGRHDRLRARARAAAAWARRCTAGSSSTSSSRLLPSLRWNRTAERCEHRASQFRRLRTARRLPAHWLQAQWLARRLLLAEGAAGHRAVNLACAVPGALRRVRARDSIRP